MTLLSEEKGKTLHSEH